MKIKKMLALVVAVLMLCSFTACSEEPQVTADDHSDWVWVRNGNTYGALSDTGYYYVDGYALHYFDFAANASTALCAKVGCSHGSDSCDAHIMAYGAVPMFFYNNYLYYCPAGEGSVYSRNATGAELKKVGDLGMKYVEEQKSVEVNSCAVADGYLFYEASIQATTFEAGVTTVRTVMKCIGRLDLSTGKDEILVEEPMDKNNEQLVLCAARKKGVLFNRWEGTNMDRNDPNYTETLKKIPVTLEYWDAETHETKELFRKTREECININMVADGKVYFAAKFGQNTKPIKYDYNFTHSYDLNTGKEEPICPYYTRYQLGGGYVYCRDIDGVYFVYNMNDGQKFACTVGDPGAILVTNTSNNGFIVRTSSIKHEEEEEEDEGKTNLRFYYIPHASLADGLQETDLQYIYTF